MSQTEQLKLDGGFTLGTGLLLPTDEDLKLTAAMESFPDQLIWDPKDIERSLADQRWKADELKYKQWVRNQESDGSCNCASNASGVEIIRDTQGMPHIELSHSFLYSLKEVSGGADNGSTLPSTFKAIGITGISPTRVQVGGMTKTLPNTIYSSRTPIPADVMAQARIEAKRFMGVRLMKIPLDDYSKFCAVVATMMGRRIPIVWAWHVGSNGSRITGEGYMQTSKGPGNHSNLLVSGKWVGGKDLVHPSNMNSWGPTADPIYGPKGPSWGRGGFAFATMEQVYSCAHIHQPYGIISVSADPADLALSV